MRPAVLVSNQTGTQSNPAGARKLEPAALPRRVESAGVLPHRGEPAVLSRVVGPAGAGTGSGQIPEACTLPPAATDDCDANTPAYTYDSAQKDCVPFTYRGCGGNANRFESREACLGTCAAAASCDAVIPVTNEPCDSPNRQCFHKLYPFQFDPVCYCEASSQVWVCAL